MCGRFSEPSAGIIQVLATRACPPGFRDTNHADIPLANGRVARSCGWTTPASAINGPPPSSPSPIIWITLLLPVVVLALLFYSMFRNARGNLAMAARSVQDFEVHRQFSEEHMKRVEAQIDRLDERLSRVIELLEAIERGQRQITD